MTPRTRTSNREADFKVYYSKKVPQQIHFPHKSKTVRRRSTPIRDNQEKRQMVFLPDKMRRQTMGVVSDSDDDSEDVDTDIEEDAEERTTDKSKQKGRKRGTGIMHEEQDSEHDDSTPHEPKHQSKSASSKSHRRTRRIQGTSDNEANKMDRERALKRQSTMTQLVDGRKPLPGVEEPDFKPVKKTSRLSWGGKGKSVKRSKDQKQRTLTQMVPGMRPLEIMSDEDMDEALSSIEAEDKDGHAYGHAVAWRLAQQGLYQTGGNDGAVVTTEKANEDAKPLLIEEKEHQSTADSQDVIESALQSVEDCDDSYRPTQFIETPSRRSGRVTRRNTVTQASKVGETSSVRYKSERSAKARFSLLSTPEKRRVCEIPSSQSPADSPLSTQFTPQKLNQSPLKQCTENSSNNAVETPSKRKQVSFEMPSKTPIPPPKLRRFESTIQDSEDEDDDTIEEDAPLPKRAKQEFDDVGFSALGRSVGTDAQSMIDQIDRACAEANDTGGTVSPESSPEPDSLPVLRGHKEPSPELGDVHKQRYIRSEWIIQKDHLAYHDEPTRIKQEPGGTGTEVPTQTNQLHSTPPILEADVQDTFPSTPMAMPEDSSDEEISIKKEPNPSQLDRRPSLQSVSAGMHQSTDLDGEFVQVPRSPSPQHETQESHSSKAEQQLQDEWLSYSQYMNVRPSKSSSLRVIPDASSYNATPLPPLNTAQPLQQQQQQQHHHHHSSGYRPSQATTVDEITQRTPRTKRTQNFSSTHTTPHRIASSQPVFISPGKPPPLFIPSSFPSPGKAGAATEEWSSPIVSMTQGAYYRSSQWASLDDFSIPLPPPPVGKGDDEEDEE
ncbi:hypothetical protein COCC4DRAFT_133135 [Bipolaris maydis ATCC 48331]|uniref:Uncharacterized protein n=2 Tax=Cochliobolus heterostrophus TaxID=5016 RepID=M2U4J9_COCH5|nr:uncharacterized protein COCC4DRAFT_133135 [Bipolaris maydis ATCC 48331]EMD93489.1 hypothetical protein COCHEDRAFT_1131861 [Bipolaris maydis C5]KAH7562416.1 hypothetical protein BM1_01936 [Bipolaris maydis]ENI07064.1 hypothetical protein COCC4DRAFT_133135 [Bipolaris maydis ATCC 48331]KAJ5027806.1 hypothetical protein J3E73DRAFT_208695 [Bipolaris maydis]KAJ6204738.1 hypothetical protein PSV09DRAFT_1131861 [Bipolaris maydis]